MKRICVLIPAMVLICQLAFSTTYTVTNTSDVGAGSLRQAITDANANPGADIINFNIPGSGPQIIQITSALIITDPITIDGYSENGTYPAGVNFPAKIKIVIDGQNGFFGNFMGIQVNSGGSGSTIKGLAIVNFDQSPYAGIYLNSCNNVIVEGNYLGIQPDGVTIAPNYYGIYLFGADNSTIGGNSLTNGNIISGNVKDGIRLELNSGASDEALNNIIQFNWIGTDNLGILNKGNGEYGIYINNGDGTQMLDNIISGNGNSGIYIGYYLANSTTGVTIQRNIIGINTTNAALGNTGYGIYMAMATNITIGGSVVNSNVIANNSLDGIYVAPASAGIDISANSIYSNGELGIDLDPNGVNPLNTAGPYASAVNPPEIDSAKVNGTNLTIYGKITNLATTTYYIEFFRNKFSLGADPSGYGEGQTYIGNTTVTTNGSGTVSFSETIAGGAIYKDYISGTSRMVSTNNTSEFALDKQAKSRIDTIAVGSGKYIRSYCIPPVPGANSYTWTVAPLANILLGQGTTCITVDYAGTVAGNYEVCVVANNSCGPSDNSCFPVQMIELTLSGNVYDDKNGMNGGNKVDGTGIGTASGSQLYVSLISGGTVYETVPVNPDGTYTFINLDNTLNYSVVLTTANTPVANPAPAATLPAGWVNTGEIHNNATNTLTGNDGIINGIVPVGIVFSNATNVNFGIDQLPNSNDVSAAYVNPGGTNTVTSPTLTGSDPEDGALGGTNTLVITSLATNGTLYYNGIAVTLNQIITSYDPTKLKVDPADGNVTVTFQYAFVDAAGFQDPTPATATLTFTDLTITGNVFDDNNGLTDNTVNGTGTNAGNTVYANLVSGANTVLASKAVSAGGTYSFGNAYGVQINTGYNVILTNGSTVIGSTLTTATLPANWVSTGEFIGTGIGNDGSPNSVLAVTVATTSISNANFGIDQLPNSDNVSNSYPNPGGTATVTVPTLTGSDPEDGTYGSGNTFKVTTLAVNGTLYYNSIAVTLNQVITNYDPTKLKVDPIDGNVIVTFQYAFIDAAGKQDPTPATATLTFIATVDLSVTKTDGTPTYTPGTTTVYTIVVKNNGPVDVTGAIVADTKPTGVTWSWSSTKPSSGSGDINETVNLIIGATVTYTVTVTIPSGYTGTLTNTATVSPPEGVNDPIPGNNTATDSDTQNSVADLSITKTDGTATYTPGTTTTYSIVVTNNGPSDVTGAIVADPKPTGVSWSWTSTKPSSGIGDINETVNLVKGASITYTVTVTIPSGFTGNLVNTATVTPPNGVTDPNPANNSATDTDTQHSVADLAITKTDGIVYYIPGTTTTYTIVVTNNGPSDVIGATVYDPKPSGVTWSWSSTKPSNGSGDINETVNLALGASITYTVTVTIPSTSSANLVNTVTVTPPENITDPDPSNNSATDTDIRIPCTLVASISGKISVSCYGGANGSATVSASVGPAPYTYQWNTSPVQTSATAVNLTAGTYTVTVTDAYYCTFTASATISQPQLLGVTVTTIPVSCFSGNNGSATASPTGGNGGYLYLWNNTKTTQTISNLTAGTYYVTVTDVKSCSATTSASVTQPSLIVPDAGPDQILCNKSSTFLVGNNPAPGTGNWTTFSGPNSPSIFPSNSSVAIAAGLIQGIYKFVYTITVGPCWKSDTMMVTNYHLPTQSDAGPDQELCKSPAGPDSTYLDGNIPVYGNGHWTQLFGPGMAHFINSGYAKTKVTNLTDGIYIFRWSIGNGICDSSTSQMQITVYTMPTAYAGLDALICGESPDTLKSSTATNYISLSWTTTGSGYFNNTGILHPIYVPSAADILAGHVKLTLHVMGYLPCGTVTDTMQLNITQPPVANAGPDGSICEGSDFCLCGATAYNYTNLWWTTSGCGTFNNPNILNPIYIPCPADFVTGCIKLVLHVMGNPPCGEVTDTVELCIRRIPIVYAGPDTTICSQTTYTINLSTALYTTGLKWTTSGDGTFNAITILHPTYTPGTGDLNLGHVTLTLLGIACSPCPNDSDKMVLSFSYPPVLHAFVVSHVNCYGENNGSVKVTLTGGKSPYYYLWSDQAQQTTQTATGLTAGTYTVTVTDYYNCTATSSATVTQPALLTEVTTISHVTCYTYNNGSVSMTVSGGTPAYTFRWSNGLTTKDISGLTADTYTVTVTDSHGCTTSSTNTVTQPPAWGPLICGLDTVCQGAIVQYCVCEPRREGSTYQWTVTCGTIIDGCCSYCVTVKWDLCAHGTICVTETRHDAPYDGCEITTCKTVLLKPVPAPAITGPAIVNAGQSGAVYCTPFYPGHLYSWSVIDGTVTSGQGTNCITVTWNSICNSCMGQVIAYETENGCCGTDTLNVTIIPGTGNLNGYVNYKNPYNTGLNGVAVTLRNYLGVVVATVYTGPNPANSDQPGYYSFPGIPDGNYHITAGFNGTWGGNNATDALIIELYTVSLYPLNGLNRKVADVNGDFSVNATDALWVKLRTVGMMNYYPAGDWKFTDTTFTLTGTATVNLQALCVGDVNGSYIPTGVKESSFLSVTEDGIMTIPVNQDFDYPVRSNIFADLGAMTLFMGFDADRFEVKDVNTPLEGMKYMIRDGQIRLAWSNTKPLEVNDNDPILTLRMKVKEPISVPTQIFEVKPGSEFANEDAIRYDDFILKMSSVTSPDNPFGYSIFNFPNPFQNTTDIVYTLPENGHVRLVLTNLFGEELSTLVDANQTTGSYTIRVNPVDDNLKPGVYLYKIKVDGETTTFNKINKMIFTR